MPVPRDFGGGGTAVILALGAIACAIIGLTWIVALWQFATGG